MRENIPTAGKEEEAMGKKTKNVSQTALREREIYKLKEPHHYAVVMYNDDFTPMDFVVEILTTVFRKSQAEAVELMMSVHKGGEAVVGRYTYDIAASKRNRAMSLAKAAGYPFRVEMKEV